MQEMAIYTLDWNEVFPPGCRGGTLTIGNFDGVHRGHLALLAEACRQAAALAGPTVAVSFETHPLQVLRPEVFKPVLTTAAERAALLQANGANHVVLLKTTQSLLQLSALEFFDQVVKSRFAARALVEGDSFGFGRNREGNIPMLEQLCFQAGMTLTVVPPVFHEGHVVSSSRVRSSLERGLVAEAAQSLGRPYSLRGRVGVGQQRGRKLGFPTANLEGIETLIPGDGVYAVQVEHGGRFTNGAANIGPNPTFGENQRKVEVHLIGYAGELVGQSLVVQFLERLRDTRPFSSVDALVVQLQQDVAQAGQVLSSYRPGPRS
jgi:riboflavin kinase/FMN adenylyltransferase